MAEESNGKESKASIFTKISEKVKSRAEQRLAAQETLCQGEKKGINAHGLSAVAAIILSVVTMLSVFLLRPKFVEFYNGFQKQKELFSQQCIKHAEMLTKERGTMAASQDAFRYLQLAVTTALTPEAKSGAGLAMARFLVKRAREKPLPYALMAKQYLEAVLDIEQRPEIRLQACWQMINAAYLMKDIDEVARASDEALKMVTDDDDKARILLIRIDAFLEKGSWPDLRALLDMTESYRSNPRWQYEFAMRKAMAGEQILIRDDWFEEWIGDKVRNQEREALFVKREARDTRYASRDTSIRVSEEEDQAETLDTVSLRSTLLNETISQFKALVDSGIELLATESLFRIARLYFHEEQYNKARKFFGDFLAHEPTVHQSETLLMMTKMARIQGRMQESEEMISTFLGQFSWNATAAEEFFSIIDEAVSNSRFEQALDLIEKYVNMPAAKPRLSELLYKAGHLASILGYYDRAEEHFKEVIARNDQNDLIVNSMLGLVEIHFKLNDIAGARHWLLAYLNRFPYEVRQGDALFDLLDLDVQRKASIADVIHIAITAANECPKDFRTIGALLLAAKKLEDIGLPKLAEKQYNKIALLHFISQSDDRTGTDNKTNDPVILQAMLGNARCLIEIGEQNKANYLLRKLCNSLQPGDLHSEAVYMWAILALNNKQRKEASRRLKLIDEKTSPSRIATRATIERMVLELVDGKCSAETAVAIVKKLNDLSSNEHIKFVRKAFMTCFNQLAEKRDTEGMQKVFNAALDGNFAAELPWQELNLRLGCIVLADRGHEPFIECMEKNKKLMKSAGIELTDDVVFLIKQAKDIEKYKLTIDKYL